MAISNEERAKSLAQRVVDVVASFSPSERRRMTQALGKIRAEQREPAAAPRV
jgi:uncharacterized membrane protein YgcG